MSGSGGDEMCLAIPGKIVELFPGTPHLATVEVAGVRRKVDLGLLQDDLPISGTGSSSMSALR